MRTYVEPEVVLLAAKIAELLRENPQGEHERLSEVCVEFVFDEEPIGIGVRKGSDGVYYVVIE